MDKKLQDFCEERRQVAENCNKQRYRSRENKVICRLFNTGPANDFAKCFLVTELSLLSRSPHPFSYTSHKNYTTFTPNKTIILVEFELFAGLIYNCMYCYNTFVYTYLFSIFLFFVEFALENFFHIYPHKLLFTVFALLGTIDNCLFYNSSIILVSIVIIVGRSSWL